MFKVLFIVSACLSLSYQQQCHLFEGLRWPNVELKNTSHTLPKIQTSNIGNRAIRYCLIGDDVIWPKYKYSRFSDAMKYVFGKIEIYIDVFFLQSNTNCDLEYRFENYDGVSAGAFFPDINVIKIQKTKYTFSVFDYYKVCIFSSFQTKK